MKNHKCTLFFFSFFCFKKWNTFTLTIIFPLMYIRLRYMWSVSHIYNTIYTFWLLITRSFCSLTLPIKGYIPTRISTCKGYRMHHQRILLILILTYQHTALERDTVIKVKEKNNSKILHKISSSFTHIEIHHTTTKHRRDINIYLV